MKLKEAVFGNKVTAAFVANKLSQLAHELHDYDFKIRNKKPQIEKLWKEVRDILSKNSPSDVIDTVKYENDYD